MVKVKYYAPKFGISLKTKAARYSLFFEKFHVKTLLYENFTRPADYLNGGGWGGGGRRKWKPWKMKRRVGGVSFDKSKKFSLAIFWYNVSWLVVNFF